MFALHLLTSPELLKSRVLELNASDERGISVRRQRLQAGPQRGAEPLRIVRVADDGDRQAAQDLLSQAYDAATALKLPEVSELRQELEALSDDRAKG